MNERQQVSDDEWDIWSVVVRVPDAQAFMDALYEIDERVEPFPAPDCCESGVLAPDVFEMVIEQPKGEARRQVEAAIARLGLPAEVAELRRGE